MIQAKLVFKEGGWQSFVATGHAGYARAGEDIVCAAFSVLVRTILRQALKSGWVEAHEINEGILSFSLFSDVRIDERVLLMADFLIMGLQDLQHEYPQQLKLKIEGME
ncbi:MAG: ribosomal-processing cysteine protease Prp [Spirochaetia bacterium]